MIGQDKEDSSKKVLTGFLANPKNVNEAETKEVLETQANLTNNAQARLIIYDRICAEEFAVFNPHRRDKSIRVNKPSLSADRLSLISQGDNAKARNDAVFALANMKDDKKPMTIESLEGIQIAPPQGQEIKKKQVGL